jgi:hypothetical protein
LSFNRYFRKYFKLVYRKNVVIVTLTTRKCFSYSLACTFGCGEFYEGGARVHQPPIKWSKTIKSLRNTTNNTYMIVKVKLPLMRFQVLMATSMKTSLGCCTVQSGRNWLTLLRCLLSLSSGNCPEIFVNFYQTTQCNIPEDSHL